MANATTDKPDQTPAPKTIRMSPPEPMDKFWLTTIQTAAQGSVAALEDAAKQLVTITSFAQTLYFAAISFGDLKKALPLVPDDTRWMYIFAFVLPVACWALSLWFAVNVFKPRPYPINLDSPDEAKDVYNDMVAFKHGSLKNAHVFLTAGFIFLVIDILVYLFAIPVAPSH